MKSLRFIVLNGLNQYEKNNSYSNIVLDTLLNNKDLSTKRDKSFISILFYGVIERKLTLDYVIRRYSKIKFKKIDIEILNILRMGLYQLIYLNSITDFATVNESVQLTKYIKKTSSSAFVNGILRSFIRDNKEIILPNKNQNLHQYYSIKYSCPSWIISNLLEQFSEDELENFLEQSINPPNIYARLNTQKCEKAVFLKKLEENKIDYEISNIIENALILKNPDNIVKSNLYKLGYFYIQDISSQIASYIAISHIKENNNKKYKMLDICSCPGGKSFTISQYLNHNIEILALDNSQTKLDIMNNNIKKLGLTNINTMINDAQTYNSNLGIADIVLVDAPCFGIGVISKKPEIKYKDIDNLKNIVNIQKSILTNSIKYVKPGGYLIYSTCSLLVQENEDVVKWLTDNYHNLIPYNFKKDTKLCKLNENIPNSHKFSILPKHFNGDGFFIAKFKKI